MRGLVLQGGGAKGAYEAGAIKALNKKKIYFDCACGTSIGAINAAFYSMRRCDLLNELWLETDTEDLFGLDYRILDNFSDGIFKKSDIKKGLNFLTQTIKNNGIDTYRMKKLLHKYIDEDRIRKSKIDFAMNTYSLSDMKPVEVFKNDIPKGKLVEYLLSSAYLPFFKFEKIIDNKYYIDGGIYSDCPVDMLIDQGYKEIYVIKAWRTKIKYKHKKNLKIHIISPRENLGSIMTFTKESSIYRMNLGYYDTLKYLENLDGNKYYFKNYDEKYYSKLFDKSTLKRMIIKYNKGIVPLSYKIFILKIVERICVEFNFDRFKVYNMPYLLTRLKYKMVGHRKNKYYDFIKNIKVDFE